jgi:squalene synthase HpnC
MACYDGSPRHPVLIALRQSVQRFRIPPGPFLDLLVAFEQDQRVKNYASFEQLVGYCKNSANPVGRIVLYLFECHDDKRGALADHICTGLQLANFWQDVARDLDRGRVYLPAEDRRRFGYGDDDLHARRFTPAFAQLLRFEIDRSRDLLMRGYPLVDLVPPAVRTDVELFILGGLGILAKIEQQGHDVWTRRPTLARWEKARLLLGVLGRRLMDRLFCLRSSGR